MNNAAFQDRYHLMNENRALLFLEVCRFVREGHDLQEAVAVVADLRDPLVADLAKALAKKTGGLDITNAKTKPSHIPTMTLVMTRQDAIRLFRVSHPNTAQGLQKPVPGGTVRVISIASGGATLFGTKYEEPPQGGTA